MYQNVTTDGFGLMTRFIVHLDIARDYTLQFTITYTHVRPPHARTHVHSHIFTAIAQ
jgi:hypothetical protein